MSIVSSLLADPVPSFEAILLPLLRFAGDTELHSMAEARTALASEFNLSDRQLAERLPSGRIPRWNSRVGWASFYLMKAGLIEKPRRGYFKITERGLEVVKASPSAIDVEYLKRFPQFSEFLVASPTAAGSERAAMAAPTAASAPEESIERSVAELRSALADELLTAVKAASPAFFEQLVVELLLKMGYGGSQEQAGRAIGQAGDEGIDGIISEDRLGLDTIYIQAKRWDSTVGRPEIQKFVGALHGKRANKGVFLTTGAFSAEAQQYADSVSPRVVLIGGQKLAEYMIDFDLGVATRAVYHLKRLDSDYFLEE